MTTQTPEASLPTGTWQIDTSATAVTVAARKLGFLNVPGRFTVTSGSIEINGDNQVSNVEIVLDSASYETKNNKRDEHVRSEDFLDSANHPDITFKADNVVADGTGYKAKGIVTIKGQASPVELLVNDVAFDASNGSFTAAATVDRSAIGVGKMPSFIIAQNLELAVDAKASRR